MIYCPFGPVYYIYLHIETSHNTFLNLKARVNNDICRV